MSFFIPSLAWRCGRFSAPLPHFATSMPSGDLLGVIEPTIAGIQDLLLTIQPILIVVQAAGFELENAHIFVGETKTEELYIELGDFDVSILPISWSERFEDHVWPVGAEAVVAIVVTRPWVSVLEAECIESYDDLHILEIDDQSIAIIVPISDASNKSAFQRSLVTSCSDLATGLAAAISEQAAGKPEFVFNPASWVLAGTTEDPTSGRDLFSIACDVCDTSSITEWTKADLETFLLGELQNRTWDGNSLTAPPSVDSHTDDPELQLESFQEMVCYLPTDDPTMPIPTASELQGLSLSEILSELSRRGLLLTPGVRPVGGSDIAFPTNFLSSEAERIRLYLLEALFIWYVDRASAKDALVAAEDKYLADVQWVRESMPEDSPLDEWNRSRLDEAQSALAGMVDEADIMTAADLHNRIVDIKAALSVADPYWLLKPSETDFVDSFLLGLKEGLGSDFDESLAELEERYVDYAASGPILNLILQIGAVRGALEGLVDWIDSLGDLFADPGAMIRTAIDSVRQLLELDSEEIARLLGQCAGESVRGNVERLLAQPTVVHFALELGRIEGELLVQLIISLIVEPLIIEELFSVGWQLLRATIVEMRLAAQELDLLSLSRFESYETEYAEAMERFARELPDPIPLTDLLDAETRTMVERALADSPDAMTELIALLTDASFVEDARIGLDALRQAYSSDTDHLDRILQWICKFKKKKQLLIMLGKASKASNSELLIQDLATIDTKKAFETEVHTVIARQYGSKTFRELLEDLADTELPLRDRHKIEAVWEENWNDSLPRLLTEEVTKLKLTAWFNEPGDLVSTPEPDFPERPYIIEGWYQKVQAPIDQAEHTKVTDIGRAADPNEQWDAAHLVPRRYGGPSDSKTNLIPMTSRTNQRVVTSNEAYIDRLYKEHVTEGEGGLYVRTKVLARDDKGIPLQVKHEFFVKDENGLPKALTPAYLDLHTNIVRKSGYGWEFTMAEMNEGVMGFMRQEIAASQEFNW